MIAIEICFLNTSQLESNNCKKCYVRHNILNLVRIEYKSTEYGCLSNLTFEISSLIVSVRVSKYKCYVRHNIWNLV